MRLGLAVQLFFRALFHPESASRLELALHNNGASVAPAVPTSAAPSHPSAPAKAGPARSDAITLLAALQREARFVDLVQESLGDYSDAEVGAAARDVLRDCQVVLNRFFAVQPLVEAEEGAEIQTPSQTDGSRYRFVGNAPTELPARGRLVHHGWEATQCELPQWSGSDDAAWIIAPAELEIG